MNLAANPEVRSRMGRPRVYPVNPGYFDALTPNGAYIVGLLQADGSNQRGRGIVCITLKRSDSGLLSAVADEMGASRPLCSDGHGNPKLMIQNRALSDGLARWGVVSPKTHTAATHPDLLRDRDYWRGLVDGDGSLCVDAGGRRLLSLVGAEAICGEFLSFARGHGAGLRVNVRPHRRIFSVHLSGREAETVARVLYADAGLALARKREVARSWGCLPGEVAA